MDIYEECDYSSFNDFFTRKSSRTAGLFRRTLMSLSVHVTVWQRFIQFRRTQHFPLKNTEYTLRSLLRSPRLAKRFRGGYAYILRLTVEDYHRYLYSVSGKQSKNYHIDGTFHTVNPIANDYLPLSKRKHARIHSNSLKRIWRCTPDGSRRSLSWQNFKPQTKHSRNPWRRKRIL